MKKKLSVILRTIGTSLVLATAPFFVVGAVTPPIKTITKDSIVATLDAFKLWFALILGVIAVIMILFGALLYLTAGGDEEKVGKAKKTILYGALGVLIIIIAYGIFTLIASFIVSK